MASLHARHSRKCALEGQWTGPRVDGCTCKPTYYVAARDGGRLVRERIGRDKQDAQRAQRKIGTREDEGTYAAQKDIAFDKWGEQWLSALERKRTTVSDYRSTIGYAKEVFGSRLVRRLSTEDVARFNKHLAGRMSTSTRAKHLRVLGACLSSAVEHKYAGTNPVSELPKSEKPRAGNKEAAYFEDDELLRLIPELTPGVFRTLFLTALATGMRQGELAAATWGDVDLTAAVIRVRRTHTHGLVQEPKNRERRDVDLPPETVKLLGEWWGELGSPVDDTLVFPGDRGYLSTSTILRRELYPAMARADIPRVGPTGEKRTFHSTRHTFARIALENGAELTWVSRHVGHSSVVITDKVYGHWSRAARRRAMQELAGKFTFAS